MTTLQRLFRGPLAWILLALFALYLVFQLTDDATGYKEVPTSEAVAVINGDDKLKEVILTDSEQTIQIEKADDRKTKIKAVWVGDQVDELTGRLNQRVKDGSLESWKGVNPTPGFWGSFLGTVIPFLVIGVIFFFLMNSLQGGGSRVMQFGKSRAKIASKDTPKTTFADVAGVDEAIEELQEIKEFLAEPAKFRAVGAKIPKGVLLYGPPGTGKTLLARAVAGEAGVPFFSISGSDFVEMFVGVGASRVRDLFEQAKESAPAIVFIDEIDAVGRHRGAGMGGGHDEREQTLNQLLVEMDGFDVRGGVILIAATNRPDVLDPALLRPGRFDRQIAVDAPDLAGREKILRVHATGKPMDEGVDLASVARRTPGFTGADLANVLNEAALLTARSNQPLISNHALDEAIDRVIAGPQRRTRLMSEHELLITAYHEGGHAMVAAAMPGTDPVQKVTILPRGKALGYTMVLPDQDKYSQTRGELLDQLAYMLGGRAAEELVFHDPTTGASNDIEKATKVARAMVTQYGMTERLGAVRLGSDDREPFVGMEMGQSRGFSERTAAIIDEEVSQLIATAHQEAFDVLQENRDVLDELVRQLLVKETLDKEQVAQVFKPLRRREKRPAWTGSDSRKPSDLPPGTPPPRPAAPQPASLPGAGTAGCPPQLPGGAPAQPLPAPTQVPLGWRPGSQWTDATPTTGWAPPAWKPGQTSPSSQSSEPPQAGSSPPAPTGSEPGGEQPGEPGPSGPAAGA
ncbi:MAG: ATP-dependent zinc metalloprotease FtsH [Actinomycetia bacterium]|nr:ATP-dependent zinc metalloprotease FtsH [Actinomycetes bacterium]